MDIRKTKGRVEPIWAWIGYDEPNYTYMKDGRKLLSELAEASPAPVFVRTHNLLTSGDGTPALKWGSTNAYRNGTLYSSYTAAAFPPKIALADYFAVNLKGASGIITMTTSQDPVALLH